MGNEIKTPSISPLMGRIERMVAEMCPEGVKWVKLGEVCTIKTGVKPNKIIENGAYKYINAGTTESGYVEEYNTNGDTVTTPSRGQGGIGFVGYQKDKFWCGPLCYRINSISPILLTRFLYYFLSENNKVILALKSVGGVPAVNVSDLVSIEIPLPPLPIQEAIADILDKFDRLSAELQAELQARKQQYEYYRNQLLTRFAPDQPVTEYSLGDLGTFTYGFTAKAKEKGKIRYIRITDINEGGFLNPNDAKYIDESDGINAYLLKKGDLVMARTGATYGKTLFYEEDYPSIYASFLIKITLKDIVNPRYYWHFSKSQYYWEQANRLVGGGAQPQFNTGAISQVKIRVPSLSEQARIVSILDKFEALVNDLSQGLPAEIAAVQEQYEYYRNKLLTFDKKS